jgi:hypothetical protein
LIDLLMVAKDASLEGIQTSDHILLVYRAQSYFTYLYKNDPYFGGFGCGDGDGIGGGFGYGFEEYGHERESDGVSSYGVGCGDGHGDGDGVGDGCSIS